jgi:hypothetical protein
VQKILWFHILMKSAVMIKLIKHGDFSEYKCVDMFQIIFLKEI